MEAPIGTKSWMKDLKLVFQTWRSVRVTPRCCLPAHGIRIGLPGVPMLLSMDPAAASTALEMRARRGLASTKVCLTETGDASESTLRQMVNAFMHSSRQRRRVYTVPTTVAILGLW